MRARGRLGQAEQQPDQRRLARAVGAEEAEGDAARHLEVDAVERRARSPNRLPRPRVSTATEPRSMVKGEGHATTVRTRPSGDQATGPTPSLRADELTGTTHPIG